MIRFQTSTRKHSPPRPTLWRLVLVQWAVWWAATLICALFAREWAASVWWAGLVVIAAQAFWIWRSLRGFGDPGSADYLIGTTVGMIGKWVIVFVGLALLWRSHLNVSAVPALLTVFALNTLAALTAPVLISRRRRR